MPSRPGIALILVRPFQRMIFPYQQLKILEKVFMRHKPRKLKGLFSSKVNFGAENKAPNHRIKNAGAQISAYPTKHISLDSTIMITSARMISLKNIRRFLFLMSAHRYFDLGSVLRPTRYLQGILRGGLEPITRGGSYYARQDPRGPR